MIKQIKVLMRFIFLNYKNRSAIIKSFQVDSKLKISKGARINKGVIIGENVSIDEYSYINDNSIVFNSNIGKFCSISYNCMIGLPNHPIRHISTSPFLYSNNNVLNISRSFEELNKQTIIGNDVWVGAQATIMKGVSIGNGAIIGAGSVVTKDIPPYAIAVGNPAKVIKYRFNQKQIEFLEELRYWDKYNVSNEQLVHLVLSGEKWIENIK
ncbi:CatB-related O-acetyltransferase [Bacillus paranthracis]|uniref:CatB-related O-acetyltransferase n=1 Tax=Bacillus paranthracis TaxID=2026186 RepID=UPI00254C6ECD|nr:CatB-related O-acetyltransferase [Bacillus paranthracis]MDK7539259.1 CatB-related O-acetyltransferase [Bacillus paranthracis]MDK7561791.1 CatB-related O-acetyltransferase [Bacillus paranthracis]